VSDDLIEQLDVLHVWPQSVADHHADILTPRQIRQLYDVGRVATEAAAELRILRAERDAAVQAEVAAIAAFVRIRWGYGPDFLVDLIECGEYKESGK